MKILLCNGFHYLRGGSERSVFDISELLIANGHKVFPFSMDHPQNLPSAYDDYFVSYINYPELLKSLNPENIIKATERLIFSREASKKLSKLIKETKPDLAHIHNIAHELSPSIFYTLSEANIPIVHTVHDFKLLCPNTSFLSHGEICERCLGAKFYHMLLRRCKRGSLPASFLASLVSYVHHWLKTYHQKVDIFITPSRLLRQKMIEGGFDAEKIVYLPHMIDTTRFQPGTVSGNYVFYFGRLVREKGIFTLVEAMTQHTNVQLKIAGEGPIERDLEIFIKQNEMTNVDIVGYQSGKALHDLIKNAAFVVVPSEVYENAPYTCYESMALGRAIIGANIGGIPELVQEGETGLLFEPGNINELSEKIGFLLANPNLQTEWGRNARDRVEKEFKPEKFYQLTMEIYTGLVELTGTRTQV